MMIETITTINLRLKDYGSFTIKELSQMRVRHSGGTWVPIQSEGDLAYNMQSKKGLRITTDDGKKIYSTFKRLTYVILQEKKK